MAGAVGPYRRRAIRINQERAPEALDLSDHRMADPRLAARQNDGAAERGGRSAARFRRRGVGRNISSRVDIGGLRPASLGGRGETPVSQI